MSYLKPIAIGVGAAAGTLFAYDKLKKKKATNTLNTFKRASEFNDKEFAKELRFINALYI